MAKFCSTFLMAGLMLAGTALAAALDVDRSVRPGDDFYAYANGDWLRTTRLPEGVAKIDTSAMLRAENARRVRGLIDDAVAATARGAVRPDVRKIADYYITRRDTVAIEAKGLAPLSGDLAAIAAIADRRALAGWLGRNVRLDDGGNQQTESLFGVWIHQGFHDPSRYAAHLVQGGLGLAANDYLDSGTAATAHRADYRARIAAVLTLAGFDQPDTRAARVLDLETAIARTHASRADTDDVFKTDNSWRRADFAARAPGIDWVGYFAAAGLDAAQSFVVWQPGAVIGVARLVATQPLDAWKDYLAFHLIDHYAAVLPRAVRGTDAPDAIDATGAVFGDAIGRLYVERYFPLRAKAAATIMVDTIRTAFRAQLVKATWMASATRTKAMAKLAALRIGLGYPDRWVDYTALSVVRGDAFGNLRRAEAFAYAHELAKLRRPVDPNEWPAGLHPQLVAAILDLSPNTMEFAVGLFQPPYFDADGDAAANYGSAGAGLAHEISHSFDEVGNIYDAQGRLGLWVTKDDLARARAAAAPLASQLDACVAAPGLTARGNQVLVESVADLRGLAAAYDAYHLSLRGKPDRVVNGLTGDQRFFVAFAQRWRRLQTDDALRAQIEHDNHAPPRCRSNLVRNMDAWARAFGVKPGDALYTAPAARVRAW
ncbi:M13 family metallopeptidase [Sphingomonas bacterium]|uniref:M13 family metallopeptidase n=1 Tax=Sphingomonas bacterium TaxID=1895847 RepID=UPI00262C98A4|nr:M13 family metallopeptidase [Sphingomonas bacterium]MDB5678823.1 family peptidase [Sphingomonas bacterium]